MVSTLLSTPFLATPRRRRIFWYTLASAVSFAIYVILGMAWRQALIALLPTIYAEVLLFRLGQQWMATRREFMRWEMRLLRSWRSYSQSNSVVDALQYLSLGIMFLSIGFIAGGWSAAGMSAMYVGVVILAVSGICETIVRISRIAKSVWAPTVGKILSVSVCVILAAISLSMAKQATHALAQIDPKYLTEFVAVATFIFIPIVYMSAAATVLLIYAAFQFMLLFLLALGDMIFGQTQIFLTNGSRERLRLYWYRIINGHRPVGGIVPKIGFLPKAHISLMASPLSKLAVVALMSSLLSDPVRALAVVHPLMTTALVALEYRSGSQCKNVGDVLPVAYMEDGWVSVARRDGDAYVFGVQRCTFADSE